MAITATTPFTFPVEELRRLVPAIQWMVLETVATSNRPFWIDGADWAALADEENVLCRRAYVEYDAFPDKRKRDAITARMLWNNHCLRNAFFKAYAAEAVQA